MAKQSEIQIKISADDRASRKLEGVADRTSKLSARIGRLAKRAAIGLGIGLAGALAISAKRAADFEKAMSNVSTLISGDSTQAVGTLRKGILDMLSEVPKSADDLGASAYDIVSAGISDTSEAIKVLKASAKLATAGLGETKQATDLMTSAINAFGKEAADADAIANVIFKTVKNGKTTVEGLAEGFGRVAGIAAQSNVTLEELLASTAALTTTGLKAAEANTGLRSAITNLLKPTATMQRIYKLLNVETGEQLIKQEGLVGSFEKVKKVADENNESLAEAFGSVEGLNVVMGLTSGEVGEKFQQTFKDMKKDTDNLTEAFDKQKQTADANFQLFKNQLDKLAIKFGRVILPIIIEALKKINQFIEDKVEPAIANIQAAWNKVVAFFNEPDIKIALSELGTALGIVADDISFIASLFGKTTTKGEKGFNKVARAVSIVIIAVSHVIVAISGMIAQLAAMTKIIIDFLDKVRTKLGGIGDFLSGGPIRRRIFGREFAEGTEFSPSGPALVGERGPEIVDLPGGSKVTPIQGAGATFNITLNVGTLIDSDHTRRNFAERLIKDIEDIASMKGKKAMVMG